MGQRAWGAHQSSVQDSLIKSMNRKRSAMPAAQNGKKNDKQNESTRARNDKPKKGKQNEDTSIAMPATKTSDRSR